MEDHNSPYVKALTKANRKLEAQLLDLRGKNEKLKYVLKSSIKVSDIFENHIKIMNKVGKKFGVKPLKTTPPPSFIKEALKADQ